LAFSPKKNQKIVENGTLFLFFGKKTAKRHDIIILCVFVYVKHNFRNFIFL